MNQKLHGLLEQRPPQNNGMAGESFREGNNRGAAAGAATRVKLSCFAVAVGRLGTASRRAGTGSVAPFCPCTSSEAGGARIAAPVLKVGETALSQKREVKQGPPPMMLSTTPITPHPAPPSPKNTSRLLPLRLLLFWVFYPGPPALCLCGGTEGGESQNRRQPIFRLTISHSLEGWVPIRWCHEATLACL